MVDDLYDDNEKVVCEWGEGDTKRLDVMRMLYNTRGQRAWERRWSRADNSRVCLTCLCLTGFHPVKPSQGRVNVPASSFGPLTSHPKTQTSFHCHTRHLVLL